MRYRFVVVISGFSRSSLFESWDINDLFMSVCLSSVNVLLPVVRTCFAGCFIVYILIGERARLCAVITYMRVARYARVRACYNVFILCYYARRAAEVNISTHPCNVLGLDPFMFRYMGRTFL